MRHIPIIELRDISVSFPLDGGKELHAVSHVSLTVEKGEIFGIVGQSGAGKSTLARVINLLQRPTSGNVIIDGQDITSYSGTALAEERKRMGMIFQHFNLIGGSTVGENVAFNLKAGGWKKAEIPGRVKELLQLVGLGDKEKAYPSQLSGGQKQRVAIARALANNPEILLCDEATSALDAETTEEIVSILREINRKMHLTIVFITHQLEVAERLFDRVAVMDHGSVIETGDTYTIFTAPQHETVRRLVSKVADIDVPVLPPLAGDEQLVKLTYRGENAYQAIISDVVKSFDITLSILHGKIEYITGKPYGVLLVSLKGSEQARADALRYLEEHASSVQRVSAKEAD